MILGQYARMSAVQGGPGFPKEVYYNYFTTGELTNLRLSSSAVPDPEIRQFVTQVCKCNCLSTNATYIIDYCW